MANDRVIPLQTRDLDLTPEQRAELERSMARHPAGKARELSRCPTCGTNASGALGTPQPTYC